MLTLEEANRQARAMGLSYGQWESKIYEKEHDLMAASTPRKQTKPSRRRYTDEEAFALWQAGKNDCEMGAILGVSRQVIQKWRDTMELPSTVKEPVDTENYHLVKTSRGMFVIYGEEG